MLFTTLKKQYCRLIRPNMLFPPFFLVLTNRFVTLTCQMPNLIISLKFYSLYLTMSHFTLGHFQTCFWTVFIDSLLVFLLHLLLSCICSSHSHKVLLSMQTTSLPYSNLQNLPVAYKIISKILTKLEQTVLALFLLTFLSI